MMDIQEARAALVAVKEVAKAFTMVSLTFERDGRTLNGTDPVTALITLQSLGADAVGCNCSSGPLQMIELIQRMKPYATVPLLAKPNAGMPKLKQGKTFFEMPAEEFGATAKRLVRAGVNCIGGCCGTTPEHIAALKKSIAGMAPVPVRRKAISAVSSARAHVILEKKNTVISVGECINPTGKKVLQEELRQGKMTLVRQLAKDQEQRGALLLDVNAGVPGADEQALMEKLITALSLASTLPLVIDSSTTAVVEKALRLYPGRALINSISAEKKKLKKLLPLAARYGAMFVVLPLTGREIPQTFSRRKTIINKIIAQARRHGFFPADMVIDGLVMAISSHPGSAVQARNTIRWAARSLRMNTICGISNISFGMPRRSLINDTYRVILQQNDLSMVIENPLRDKERFNRSAAAVLLGKDKDAARYIAYCRKTSCTDESGVKQPPSLSAVEKVRLALVQGNRDDIKENVAEALKRGALPEALVNETMIPAMNEVGDLFDKKIYFLPQLIASAETMKSAFEYLDPLLRQAQVSETKKTVVILATVQGDIHDIGKNIVALMLKNHGFIVVDLGKDVPAKRIITEIKKHFHPLVGLSALMTTTMVHMPEVIALALQEKLDCRFLVGGAVVTKSYAHSIGAEYGADSVDAVRLAKRLQAEQRGAGV
jgi:5-methyltetrahydrofolate--homocysteine methyltransferase